MPESDLPIVQIVRKAVRKVLLDPAYGLRLNPTFLDRLADDVVVCFGKMLDEHNGDPQRETRMPRNSTRKQFKR